VITFYGKLAVPKSTSPEDRDKLLEILRNDFLLEIEALAKEYGVKLVSLEVV
jgi:hypothetical protein